MKVRWRVELSLPAKKQFAAISDRRVQQQIQKRIDSLEYKPEKQGKPMTNELAGCYSVRAVGQRYRIIYLLKESQMLVLVVALASARQAIRPMSTPRRRSSSARDGLKRVRCSSGKSLYAPGL